MADRCPIHGAGLGLRRTLLGPLADLPSIPVDFFEVAPENWIGVGGRHGKQLRAFTERYPFVTHGLSLSLGGPSPLDETFLHRLKRFLDTHGIATCTEHLSYCGDDGHLYDLLPIPFTHEAVRYVAARIRRVQDILERRIAVENVSYYAAPGQEMAEVDFLNAVLAEADCELLLDVNNLYVNSVNHGYDAHAFLAQIPGQRIAYLHIAGHYVEAGDLLIDTHGTPVVDPVWALLDETYARFGMLPTLLERDFNIPPLPELLGEVARIAALQARPRNRRSAGMAERSDFQQRQLAFAAHIRDPQHNPRPADVPGPRMAVYRELIYNNLDSFLANTLPVLHSLLDTAHWHALVRDFLVKHRAHSPYFLDIPREFLSYLDMHRSEQPDDPPFLRELAHYEWVELALSVHDAEIDFAGIDRDGDPLDGHPVLSPLARPLQYAFPVHRIGQDFQPTEAPGTPTFLLVHRDAEDTVRFLELNPVSARLIGLLAEHVDDGSHTGRPALDTIAHELQHPQPEQVVAHGLELLRDWQARGILLGTSRRLV